MKTNLKVVLAFLAVALGAGTVVLVLSRSSGAHAPVAVTIRISVAPPEQCSFVAGQATSARFKYLVGKQANVKPALAQKLTVKPIPNSAIIEARAGASTREEAERYASGFVELLQALCGQQAQIKLIDKSIR
jgi:hypothetical protein